MPARSYSSYYETGTTVRKKNTLETSESINDTSNRRYGKNKTKTKVNNKTSKKTNKALVVVSLAFAFSMIMTITYRYNIISEKNLETQKLKSQLETTESTLLTSKIAVEQNTNLDYVEAYAKQKLGMQKPTSTQTIYVDTSNITQVVEVNEKLSFIENIINKVKLTLKNIF